MLQMRERSVLFGSTERLTEKHVEFLVDEKRRGDLVKVEDMMGRMVRGEIRPECFDSFLRRLPGDFGVWLERRREELREESALIILRRAAETKIKKLN